MNSLHHSVGRSLAVHFGRRGRGGEQKRMRAQPGVVDTKAKRAAKKAAQESLSKRFSQPRGLEGVSAEELFDATDGGIRKLDGLIRRMRGMNLAQAHKGKALAAIDQLSGDRKVGRTMSDVAKETAEDGKKAGQKASELKKVDRRASGSGFVKRLASASNRTKAKKTEKDEQALRSAVTGESAQAEAAQVREHLLDDTDGVAQRAHRTYVDTRASLAFA